LGQEDREADPSPKNRKFEPRQGPIDWLYSFAQDMGGKVSLVLMRKKFYQGAFFLVARLARKESEI
jgi:hypothetical protein